MKRIHISVLILLLSWAQSCRGCDERVSNVSPSLSIAPTALDFGAVKVSSTGTASLVLTANTQAPVAIQSLTFEALDAEFFRILNGPEFVPGLSSVTVSLSFSPTEYRAYLATLVVASDDPDRPFIRIPLIGEGASSKIAVTPTCDLALKCQGQVTVSPPEIDFGSEPLVRRLPIPATALPQVAIVNEGKVDLNVTSVSFEGDDAPAFSIAGNVSFPADGMTFQEGEGVNLAIRFVPTSGLKNEYQATLRVISDDIIAPVIEVALKGSLRPNLPPKVCANITRVLYQDGTAPADFNGPSAWAPLLEAPPSGYDFSTSRDIRPNSEVTLSALSNLNDVTSCTTDAEDGRTGLLFQWRILEQPAGATPLTLSVSNQPQLSLKPSPGADFSTGNYLLELAVSDSLGATTAVPIRFVVAWKEDLVVQLSWPGYSDVDLDLHLIRPSATTQPTDVFDGAFASFSAGISNKTAGDINGYAATLQKTNPALNFDWGEVGTADDPRLAVDDKGSGNLLERISLNDPENDSLCATTTCTYKVMVHYFKDGRAAGPTGPCQVSGCVDGEACNCSDAQKSCVANSAPQGAAASGVGGCFDSPKPLLKIFVKGDPVPAKVIPLETDLQTLGAPCQMLALAEIVWPSKSDVMSGAPVVPNIQTVGADSQGLITQKKVARFGYRLADDRQCSPNSTAGAFDWYEEEDDL